MTAALDTARRHASAARRAQQRAAWFARFGAERAAADATATAVTHWRIAAIALLGVLLAPEAGS